MIIISLELKLTSLSPLAGYGDTTLYETTESFEANTKVHIIFKLLSAGEIGSYKTYRLSNIGISDSYAKSLGHLEAVEAALNSWGEDELANFFRDQIWSPDALQIPQPNKVLQALRRWLIDNQKGAEEWGKSALGMQHYSDWVDDKVLRFSNRVLPPQQSNLPPEFVPKNTRLFHLSYQILVKPTSVLKRATLMHWEVRKLSLKTANGIKITHDQDFHSDLSDTLGDSAEELLLHNNTRVDTHEAIHTWGHKGHDRDPLWLAIRRCHRRRRC